MRFLSVCSGIEAASVAWEPLGWEAAAFAEIDPFASAVLAHRYPHVPNLGDFTQIGANDVGAVDLLIGGTPCQDFSVAGLRAGMAGDRGQLTVEFLRLAARVRPEWVVWENVPGVLSADRGLAFGTFLGGLADIGYGFAYRVLDAQYFGVPQRRRRVFVVGRLGDWRGAASVLFERESLSGYPAPRRKSGKVDPTIPSRSSAGGGLGTDFDCDGGLIASEMLVAHTLKAEGHDASEDGTGRGVPLVVSAFTQNSRSEVRLIAGDGDTVGALTAEPGAQGQNYVVAFNPNRGHSGGQPAIAFTSKDDGGDATEGVTPTLRSMGEVAGNQNGGGQIAVAFMTQQTPKFSENGAAFTITADSPTGGGQPQCVMASSAVRRLTPIECERLMGFPDDWTLVPDPRRKGKLAADQPRYHALGNSMAVPVIRWLGERIVRVVERIVP